MERDIALGAQRHRRRAGRLLTSLLASGILLGTSAGVPSAAHATAGARGDARSAVAATGQVPAGVAPRQVAARVMPVTTAERTAQEGACGGPVEFGKVVDCPRIASGERHVYTVTAAADKERLVAQLVWSGGRGSAFVSGSDDAVLCRLFVAMSVCTLPTAGTYKITVVGPDAPARSTDLSYLLGVDSWTNPATCADLPAAAFSASATGTEGTLPAGSTGRCYSFAQASGAVVEVRARRSDSGGTLMAVVEDANGTLICNVAAKSSCRLRGPGPYRLFLAETDGAAAAYRLFTTRLTQPDGCPDLPIAAFGGPGDRTATGTISDGERACRTLSTTAGTHLIAFGKDAKPFWRLFDPAGAEVQCTPAAFGAQCTLPKDGSYSLIMEKVSSAKQAQAFEAAVYRPAGVEGCSPSIGMRMVLITRQSRLQVDCHGVEAEPGDRLRVNTVATTWIIDGSGAEVCPEGRAAAESGCALPGSGPYRVISMGRWNEQATTQTYTLHSRVLTDAKGCALLRPGKYNSAPVGGPTTNPCRALIVPVPGRYRVELVDEKNNTAAGQVLDSAGQPVCDTGWCTFPAAGRYRVMAKASDRYSTVFLPEVGAAADGCVSISDAPTAAAQDVSFAAGQHNCLVLPTPAGAHLAMLGDLPVKATGSVELGVFDSAGKPACDLVSLTQQSCLLKGAGPFRVLANTHRNVTNPVDFHRLAFVRTGGAAACPELPAGAFGTAPSTDVTLSGSRVTACFAVPETRHIGTELFTFRHTEPLALARLSVFDKDGQRACTAGSSTAGLAVCRLGAGPATVLVEGFGSFAVGRHDVTGPASGCRQLTATGVGARSVAGTLASESDVQCHQVAAQPADHVMIDLADSDIRSKVMVFDQTGTPAGCAGAARACTVTGSSGYQVLVWGGNGLSTTSYELDAWKVWTAGGPPSECPAVPSGAYGFGPYAGTLGSTQRAVCFTTTRRHDDDLVFTVGNPAAPGDGFGSAKLYAVTGAGVQPCTAGPTPARFTCPPGSEATGQAVFLLTSSARSKPHPYQWEATCATPLCGDSRFTVTTVAPAALTTGGTRTITITGTSLHLGDTVRVTPAGRAPITATVKTVSADRTTMTAEVDLGSASGGAAGVEVRANRTNLEPAVLPGALRLTMPVLRATRPPVVTGRFTVGQAVTATPGAWTPTATSFTYQWAANGVAIKGATGRSYVLPAAMSGKRLTVTVRASSNAATPGTATSAPSAPVAKGAAPKVTKKPEIRGTAKVGRTVRAATGTWSPRPDGFRFEWRLNGKVVAGATGASLKLTKSMAKKRLTVTVIAVKKGYVDGRGQSQAVAVRR